MVADVVDVARGIGGSPPAPPFVYAAKRPVLDIGAVTSRYYLRLATLDKPGVLGKVCTILGHYGVSIASCIQQEARGDKLVPVVLMTHETQESSLRKALAEIDTLDFIREPHTPIRCCRVTIADRRCNQPVTRNLPVTPSRGSLR